MDLEGHELLALLGATRLLASQPPIVFAEANDAKSREWMRMLAAQLNYTMRSVTNSRVNFRLTLGNYSGTRVGTPWGFSGIRIPGQLVLP